MSKVLDLNKEIESYRVEVKEGLEIVNASCVYCYLLNGFEKANLIRHSAFNCPLSKDIEKLSKDIKALIRSKQIKLIKDSYYFICLLPIIICALLNKNQDCLKLNIIFRILALFYIKRIKLKINIRLNLNKTINIKPFLRLCLKRVYIKELGTEALKVIELLLKD